MYKVLEPIKVGNFTLKNRMMFLAMAKYIDNEDYTISDREIAYMAERAKGGAAVVCTGCCVIDNDYPGRLPNQPGMFDDKFIPGMKKLADAVHQYGALVLMQPLHHGIANYNASKETEKNPNNFTREDMEHLKQLYVDAAIRCKKAGIDGFEIHAAHNYLLQEFMVPKWNARTDEYGIQNPENASRFICEIVRAVREAVGLDFLLPFKVNGSDFVEGGCDIEFVSECCKYVEAAGVDFIAVSGGGSESNIFAMSADGHREEGWKVPLAEVVKSKVKIPVMGTGSIRTPAYIEEILSAGKVDMIGMGRGLLAEPEWINKVAAGRECDLNQCINCLQCFDIAPIPGNSGCSVNPYALRESEHLVPRKDGQGRVVAVIGGGAAGMQAAITLAERAFQPVIFEETASLGGQERYAAMPEGKYRLNWHLDYMKRQLAQHQVEIRLNTKATEEAIAALKPYAIFMANGAEAVFPANIPGINLPLVQQVLPTLDRIHSIQGQKIVLVGSGLVGLETAETLARGGNDVTLIDMIPAFSSSALTVINATMNAMMVGVKMLWEHKLSEIREGVLVAEEVHTGKAVELPADMVVLCMGFKPNQALAEQMKGLCATVVPLGNAVQMGNIVTSVQNGFDAAMNLQA